MAKDTVINTVKCPFFYRKDNGIIVCVNGLEMDGITSRPCSHPELNCYFTRTGIIPLPVNEQSSPCLVKT